MKVEQLQTENNTAGDLTAGFGGFCWKPDTGLWASGHVCYAGKWPVGKVEYTSRSKRDAEHQGAFMRLPGLNECLGYFATEEEARARVESAARYWIKHLNTTNDASNRLPG